MCPQHQARRVEESAGRRAAAGWHVAVPATSDGVWRIRPASAPLPRLPPGVAPHAGPPHGCDRAVADCVSRCRTRSGAACGLVGQRARLVAPRSLRADAAQGFGRYAGARVAFAEALELHIGLGIETLRAQALDVIEPAHRVVFLRITRSVGRLGLLGLARKTACRFGSQSGGRHCGDRAFGRSGGRGRCRGRQSRGHALAGTHFVGIHRRCGHHRRRGSGCCGHRRCGGRRAGHRCGSGRRGCAAHGRFGQVTGDRGRRRSGSTGRRHRFVCDARARVVVAHRSGLLRMLDGAHAGRGTLGERRCLFIGRSRCRGRGFGWCLGRRSGGWCRRSGCCRCCGRRGRGGGLGLRGAGRDRRSFEYPRLLGLLLAIDAGGEQHRDAAQDHGGCQRQGHA